MKFIGRITAENVKPSFIRLCQNPFHRFTPIAGVFWRALCPCILHMLLSGANGTKLSNATSFTDKRRKHQCKPLHCLLGLWVTCNELGDKVHHVISRMNDSHQLWACGSTPVFPVDISIWWMTEGGLDCTLLLSDIFCMYCNASFPFIHQNWSYCRALRTAWMFVTVLFAFSQFYMMQRY